MEIDSIFVVMSGDNLHGKQPIKFYSEEVTLTKVQLLEKQLSLGDKVSDLEAKHKAVSYTHLTLPTNREV